MDCLRKHFARTTGSDLIFHQPTIPGDFTFCKDPATATRSARAQEQDRPIASHSDSLGLAQDENDGVLPSLEPQKGLVQEILAL